MADDAYCDLTRGPHEWMRRGDYIQCRRCWLNAEHPELVTAFVRPNGKHIVARNTGVRVRAYSTDIIIHSREQSARFDAMVSHEDGHWIFHPVPGRGHFRCETTLGIKELSALRFAKSRAGDVVEAAENVTPTCGHIGDVDSGEGYCVNPDHLIKVIVQHGDERLRPCTAVATSTGVGTWTDVSARLGGGTSDRPLFVS